MIAGIIRLLLMLSILAFLNGCVSESNFSLSEESRLPVWFKLPDGKKREDVSVQLSYYVKSSGREARLVLNETESWFSTKKVQGQLKGSEPLRPGNASRNDYPRYEVLHANGLTDIIAHKGKNNVFYMVDDPAVWSALGIERT